ncbi:DUF2141 domain-containing protein [Novosphingobium aquiterrae]|uniref:DUF2141 domain-containing protein n=1 Tax=Novosphingobium aquiterrae TaxID=624388 RepID=A0ABV6PHM4_9SPHN
MRFKLITAAVVAIGAASGSSMATPLGSNALQITVSGIKSDKGVIRIAVCPPQAGFPECKASVARTASLKIVNGTAHAVLDGLPAGTYAVSAFHDANDNGKLDTFVGIPKEGYGFSRNPAFKPRAPRFDETEITITSNSATAIKLRYLL